jgi:uncharacterized Tic20 family protein
MGEETYAIEKSFELQEQDRALGAFCYGGILLNLVTGIGGLIVPLYVLISEKKNTPPLKLHAIQSLASQGGFYVITVLAWALVQIITNFTCLGLLLAIPLGLLLPLACVGALLYWAFKTYQGQSFYHTFYFRFCDKAV